MIARLRVLVVATGCALVATPNLAERWFQGPVNVIGHRPWEVAAADLDGDGHTDLVTANRGSGGCSVLFGRGDGSFEPELRIDAAHELDDVVLEDIDGDGIRDILLGGLDRVVVLRGLGDRTFEEAVAYDSWFNSFGLSAMAVFDFEDDGLPDVVLGAVPALSTHAGLGGGELGPPITYSGGHGVYYILPGDYDEDGCVDFVADLSNGGFAIWAGDCAGGFARGPITDSNAFDGEQGDFDGDGHLDLATVRGNVCVHLGRGDGGFDPAVCYPTDVLAARKMTTADLNGDGHVDFVVASLDIDEARLGVLLSNGDGTFQPAQHFAGPLLAGALASGDFDSDGRADLAIASFYGYAGPDPDLDLRAQTTPPLLPSSLVAFMFGDGRGGLSDERVDRQIAPLSIAADLDGDGILDLAREFAGGSVGGGVGIRLGDGEGHFTYVDDYPVGDDPVSLTAGLLDGGESPDLVTANRGSDDVSVLLGNGDGTFASAPSIPIGSAPAAVVLAPLVGGGATDLATANADAGSVSVFSGHGDGSFAPAGVFPVGDQPAMIVAADFDDAGGWDLATANAGSMDVSVLLGAGDGSFAAQTRHPTGIATPRGFVVADFDRDGAADLAVGGVGELAQLVVLYGDGAGGFSEPVPVSLSLTLWTLTTADLDGNGWTDLIATHFRPLVSVVPGGPAGFGPRMEYASSIKGVVAVGDFSGDGLLDLAVDDRDVGGTAMLINQLQVRVEFDSASVLTWRRLVGYDRFNTYRGRLADLQVAAPTWGACLNASDPDLTDNALTDTEVPPEGSGFFYLMARVRDGIESDLGSTSAGLERLPMVPCAD